ncbi:galactose-1-phosphate uridylyltransferase [Marinithermus hydrothermalis]|uniref:Galactose-1-phosphate uridylyltransferase n=1 Tax=Marinithermus hydrothermalis (strain DSM 14884 / JCM 11576 / T1) TaxID=869210 RepID=F2NPV4_MARHT|nr:galactose-1-phosphate uridylyltransferase [Marinithermus hydrothermalis]AEB12880.1 galactose-1-phosphate uridylyltransferase [Marinithermus hydrothermalis DSM 14884]
MHKRRVEKPDGRYLYLYGHAPPAETAAAHSPTAPPPAPHLRWHPLRQEWVIYAAHRQDRTHLPPETRCPLCPARPDAPPGEIPFATFEIAVFQNRFPALTPTPPPPPDLPVPAAPAHGACEVVVYTPEHTASLATLPPQRRELLVRVWADRYAELLAHPAVRYVMPFENRGEAVGVTLHHPHGQIYAYPFLPPVPEREAAAFREGPVLLRLLETAREGYTVLEDAHVQAFVPPFARFPYEVWVAPKRPHPGPWTFTDAETQSFARMLGEIAARYDALFQRPCPYLLALHAAPKGTEAYYHFHAEFYPYLRAPNKLKYLAGTEVGAGAFTVDVLPEVAAQALRETRA